MAFGLPTKGMVGFLDIPKETVVEMRKGFSGSDVPFRAPSKKKEMKMEFLFLHDIMAKALCAKSGSFDMVTSKNFDLMVAITAGLKADLGESVKLHTQKLLTNKSVHMYIKNNLTVIPVGESSTEDTASGTEEGGGASSQVAPMKSKSETSSDEDSCMLAGLKDHHTKCNKVVESSDSEAIAFVPPMLITRKNWTEKAKKVPSTENDQAKSQLSGLVLTTDKHMRKLSKSG
ncbi:pentatricopeptide repeat-containing protein [Dorcoceras hygrometricum]|uniref:Pentatricopeptide repeat-containing protein n=1 Tax=Dorcoceras hygrometricum TaxID=472368 RepID=A0A2Z7CX88_9LAMI|nr:pentatricopeptide repeat-containing protein [Dorcoceras hygrometricum]